MQGIPSVRTRDQPSRTLDHEAGTWAMLLKPTGRIMGEYRRVGLVLLHEHSGDWSGHATGKTVVLV